MAVPASTFDSVPAWVKHPITKVAECIPGIGFFINTCVEISMTCALHRFEDELDKPSLLLTRNVKIASLVQDVWIIALFATLIALSVISPLGGGIALGIFGLALCKNIAQVIYVHKEAQELEKERVERE